jgi:hypothetical protein
MRNLQSQRCFTCECPHIVLLPRVFLAPKTQFTLNIWEHVLAEAEKFRGVWRYHHMVSITNFGEGEEGSRVTSKIILGKRDADTEEKEADDGDPTESDLKGGFGKKGREVQRMMLEGLVMVVAVAVGLYKYKQLPIPREIRHN